MVLHYLSNPKVWISKMLCLLLIRFFNLRLHLQILSLCERKLVIFISSDNDHQWMIQYKHRSFSVPKETESEEMLHVLPSGQNGYYLITNKGTILNLLYFSDGFMAHIEHINDTFIDVFPISWYGNEGYGIQCSHSFFVLYQQRILFRIDYLSLSF